MSPAALVVAVVVLAGCVVIGLAADWLGGRLARRCHTDDEQAAHRRLLSELDRQP